MNDGGWHPPFVTINDVVTVDLNEAIQKPNSPFKACQDFVWAFQQYGNENGIPPIMLASFAMQVRFSGRQTRPLALMRWR